jgi:feruloyl esterase
VAHTIREPGPRKAQATLLALLTASALLAGCGGSDSPPAVQASPSSVALTCDDSMKTAFKPDANTSVIAVKLFKAGEQITLPTIQQPVLFTTPPPTAAFDLCMVKLLVGPGVPGPASAPSTSPGIGIEAWLPAGSAWDRRLRVLGVGGPGRATGNHRAGFGGGARGAVYRGDAWHGCGQ